MPEREHRRVKLRMPVRLRWTTPFSQESEICHTLDVSRSGLLVESGRAHQPGAVLWVTSPYHDSLADGQPEVPARVVRAGAANGKGALEVALQFEFARAGENGGSNGHPGAARRPLSIPVRVRPRNIPWFEQAMTLDASPESLRFLSTREYHPGEPLLVSFDPASASPWQGQKEFTARILHVEPVPASAALAVTLERVRPGRS